MQFQEHYNAKPMAANSALGFTNSVAGFLCTVAGTITITDADGTVLLNAFPVAAGTFAKIPISSKTNGTGSVQLAGGAAGTLLA